MREHLLPDQRATPRVEIIYTRDERVPFDDDPDMEHSWRSVPVPPSDDPAWMIWDDTPDRKTGWIRWRRP
jgi:hypothetical protein